MDDGSVTPTQVADLTTLLRDWIRVQTAVAIKRQGHRRPAQDRVKLDVIDHRGAGTLSVVTTVQRINTHGGVVNGVCDLAGTYQSVPYSADYVFLRKGT